MILDNKTIKTLRAHARPRPPENVDCMTCLVARTKLDRMVAREPRGPLDALIELELRVTSWS